MVGVATSRGQETRIIDNGGNLVGVANNRLNVNTELNYDTTSINMADEFNIVIDYKLNGSTIQTETIVTVGTLVEVIKT